MGGDNEEDPFSLGKEMKREEEKKKTTKDEEEERREKGVSDKCGKGRLHKV